MIGTIVVFSLVFVPLTVFAFFGTPGGSGRWARPLLLIPCLVYGISVVLEIQKILPLKEKFRDIYVALDNAIYVPFVIAYTCLTLYYFLVMLFPSRLVAKGVGVLTAVLSIALYVICGVYAAYLQVMSVLGGGFGTWEFLLYIACFALDVATYFLMLSILMTHCAMHRDIFLRRREIASGNAALGPDSDEERGL
jgi:hypothetical protein